MFLEDIQAKEAYIQDGLHCWKHIQASRELNIPAADDCQEEDGEGSLTGSLHYQPIGGTLAFALTIPDFSNYPKIVVVVKGRVLVAWWFSEHAGFRRWIIFASEVGYIDFNFGPMR